jgi:ABC-type Fe3+-siderophore transport system permease subunit
MTNYGTSILTGPAPLDPSVPADARAFSPRHAAIATFIGSAVAGGIVLAISERRHGAGKIAQHLLVGLGVTGACIVVGNMLPVTYLLPLLVSFGMQAYAKQSQSATTAQLIDHGRLYGGGWAGLIGLVCLVAILGVLFAMA